MIFSSTEFLTDYFLDKSMLTNECVKISTSFSKKLNTTLNCSINYKELYSFIDKFKEKTSIKDIDYFLSDMRRYILNHYEKFMSNYLLSREVTLQHQILMLNKFDALKNDCPLEDMYGSPSLIYKTHHTVKKGLYEIQGLTGEIKNEGNINIKNVYLIQIYKSYFASVVREGMSFILGSKAAHKSPTVIQLQKKEDIDRVSIVELAYLMLISNKVPTNDEINHSKIIRMYTTDLNENVYQVDS